MSERQIEALRQAGRVGRVFLVGGEVVDQDDGLAALDVLLDLVRPVDRRNRDRVIERAVREWQREGGPRPHVIERLAAPSPRVDQLPGVPRKQQGHQRAGCQPLVP